MPALDIYNGLLPEPSSPESRNVPPLNDDSIVITGISGMYPKAQNIKEFSDILYNKVNPFTLEDVKWNYKHPEAPKYAGVCEGMDLFDAQFFTVNNRLGQFMEPTFRKLLEHTYQAIFDAGLSPKHLIGKRIGVVTGCSATDADSVICQDVHNTNGLCLVGSSRNMLANRISFWLNSKGPSVSIDASDCSSATALAEAYSFLKRGDCEAAIVGGVNLSLDPRTFIFRNRSSCLSRDGKTKSFAEDSDGYILSDGLSVIFLQKAKDALRIYAELAYAKSEFTSVLKDEIEPKFNYCRDPFVTSKFISQFYKEIQVRPQDVEYVEAYGTAVPDADKLELEAIAKVYCENRMEPLLVGSVTSNIGVTVAASCLVGLSKVILGYHHGKLAPNLHCSLPRQDVAALREGRMQVVTEPLSFGRTYTAINGMSFTGNNSHVLLLGHYKPKDLSRYKSSIPYLVSASGRLESSINRTFDYLKSKPVDAEEIALLHNIHSKNIRGHLGRGYIILDTDENQKSIVLREEIQHFEDKKPPLWFVFSGMGSQWAGMAAQLMHIPIFATVIKRCHKVLEPKGVDLIHVITSPEKTTFDNIIHKFIGITAVQIGLADILRGIGLEPDGIIGFSMGELVCAYVDDCLTAEETILLAYYRGLVSQQLPFIHGTMAAVGLGYAQISGMCPPEIEVACHNSSESSTITGPTDAMREFIAKLSADGVFVKEVACGNIAYHSRYVKHAGPPLLKLLKEVIKNPKLRSHRWISTSTVEDTCDVSTMYSSAEYFTNNILNPVLFEEQLGLIPSNAVLVELAPHGQLQSVLKRALTDCQILSLLNCRHPNNLVFLLQAIGSLYVKGYTLNLQALYPKVEFPVSTETPMISHLPEWHHSVKWWLNCGHIQDQRTANSCNFLVSVHDDEHSYLRGNVVREKMCYPFSAALVAVWDMFSMSLGKNKRNSTIKFNDIQFYAQPLLYNQRPLRLDVTLNHGCGRFEVISGNSVVATGYAVMNVAERSSEFKYYQCIKTETMTFTSEDIYHLLTNKDYMYSGEFCSIVCADESLSNAALAWNGNWVTLIDGMLQLNVLRQAHDGVSLPAYIRTMCIYVKEHINKHQYRLNGKTVITAHMNELENYTRCGGVLLKGIEFRKLPPVTNKLELSVPFDQNNYYDNDEIYRKPPTKSAMTLHSTRNEPRALEWLETPLEHTGIIVKVHYAGLNLLDVQMPCTIKTIGSYPHGMDYSGTLSSGERVMGIVHSGAVSTRVCALPELLWPVPARWTLEEAATVPLAYVQAFYCLGIKAKLYPGLSVLVHGGAGALGQAAISIALAHDCQVFTTVSDIRKKQFLKQLFPQLKDDFIGNSRDITFRDMIVRHTNGEGCHIVISCVKDKLRDVTIDCGSFFSITLDTSLIRGQDFGMNNLNKDNTYTAVDFSTIFKYDSVKDRKVLHSMLSEGIARGYVRPLSHVTYAPHDAARALKLLTASQHRGRVLLDIQDSIIQAQHSVICVPELCHLMIWDEDILGVYLAERLIYRGARKLYIHCASFTPYQRNMMRSWRKSGVEVVLSNILTKDNVVDSIINDAMSLGAIEGIYVVISNIKGNKNIETLIHSLDSAARISCPKLRYFAVVSTAGNMGNETCLSRAKCGLAATSLDLSCLRKGPVCYRNAVEVIERALCSTNIVLCTREKNIKQPSLLQILDMNVAQKLGDDLTLEQLGVPDEKLKALQTYLQNTYNLYYTEEQISLLTIQKMNQLQESVLEVVPPIVKGLSTFFSEVETDEVLASTPFVILPTLYKDITLTKDEIDTTQRHLCIVPGLEGYHGRFRTMCERLKLPALVLQPGFEHQNETLRESALRYAEILKRMDMIRNNFYILGYESGVPVALELAGILEEQGLTGTVFCIGLTPDEFQAELKTQLDEFDTQKQLEDGVIRHMCTLMLGQYSTSLEDILQNSVTWKERVEACVHNVIEKVSHSVQYACAVVEAALARIKQAQRYNTPARQLHSQCVWLRAATAHASPQHTTLQQYSRQPVAVHQLETPLSYIANDSQCAAIVNRYLDADTLETFEKINLCNAYTVQSETFM